MTKKKKRIIIGVIVLIFLSLLFRSFMANKKPDEKLEATQEIPAIKADLISYGNWTPDGNRSVLVTVASDAEVDIVSELSGTIARVYAKAGDIVKKGQHLASFERSFDQTQIAYQNALVALDTAKASANNSVQSAEIALQNAEANLAQTIATEDQGILQVFETLRTQALNTESSFQAALDLVDQWVGYTPQYRYSTDDRSALSSRDRILFNQLYTQTGELLRSLAVLKNNSGGLAPGSETIGYARERVNFAKRVQPLLVSFENLAQRALISDTFTQTDASTLLTSIRTQKSTINTELLSLETALENARTANERKAAAILTAENAVKNAQSNLELSQANANSQIQTAQNQANAAYASKTDLIIKAPFSGTIAEKFVNVGQQVSPNQQLFKILNPDAKQKAVGFLTTKELQRLTSQDTISLNFGANDVELDQSAISSRLDSTTQKMRVEFFLPEDLEETILVGQIGKLVIDTDQTLKNIIPLSAVAFEPDGAEVLVVDQDGATRRQKVIVDSLESDGITILSGLSEGDFIVQYRNRVYAGQPVEPPQQPQVSDDVQTDLPDNL